MLCIVRYEHNEFEICDSCDVDKHGSVTLMATNVQAIAIKQTVQKILNGKRCTIGE